MAQSDTYFQEGAAGEPAGEAIFFDLNGEETPFEITPGLSFQPILGQGLAINLVRFAPHTEAPMHAHSEEQIVLALEGEVEFEVNGETRTLTPGQGIVIPPFVPHGARTREQGALEIDVFHPPRQGLAEAIAANRPPKERDQP